VSDSSSVVLGGLPYPLLSLTSYKESGNNKGTDGKAPFVTQEKGGVALGNAI